MADHDHQVQAVRNALGNASFEYHWRAGATMTIEETVGFALREEAAGAPQRREAVSLPPR
jgi:hypothetical protein